MNRKILGIDPGKETGVAVFDGENHSSTSYDREGFYDNIESFIKWADEVVIERFTITNATLTKSRGDNWSLEFIGIVRYLCYVHNKPCSLQLPAEAMSFATNDKLKKAGWHKAGPDHPNDASRHVMVHILKKKYMTPGELNLI